MVEFSWKKEKRKKKEKNKFILYPAAMFCNGMHSVFKAS
jgi:hypothetical protein